MTQSVEIRTVDHGDFDAWVPLWEGYQHFYEVEIPKAVTRETWARILDPAEPMDAVIATVRGRALGFAHSIYHRSTWTTGDYCYLQDLFVEAGARGFGVGRALIEHVYADARSRGAPRVYWSTHETNHSAMELYDRVAERSGFVIYRKTLD
jgi:GNAT superfamily N-acetyltransferase